MITWLFGKKKRNSWYKPNYPKTVAEILDDSVEYVEGTHEAVVRFKKNKPYRGELGEVQQKFREFNSELARIHKIEEPNLVFVKHTNRFTSCYFPIWNMIVLEVESNERYSVVTFLHEFGHALRKDERETCRWSINLFRKHFPNSYARLEASGHLLMRRK